VTGKTDQKVNNPKSEPAPEHRDFYEGRQNEDDEPTLKQHRGNNR